MTAPFSDLVSPTLVSRFLNVISLPAGESIHWRSSEAQLSSTEQLADLLLLELLKVCLEGGPGQSLPFFWQLMQFGHVSSH